MKTVFKDRSASAFLLLWVALVSSSASVAASEVEPRAINVVVSIKPLALLIEPLLADSRLKEPRLTDAPVSPAQVDVLLPTYASPHSYAMKISDRQKMQGADLLVWVGEDLERFLQKPIAQMPPSQSLAASKVPGINWPHPEEDTEGSGEDGHNHEGLHDPHLWLNPQNAIAVISAVAKRLTQIDPPSEEVYRSRAKNLIKRIKEIDAKILEKADKFKKIPFVVSHDGFAHFVDRYGLNQIAAIRSTVDSKPGARHLYQLKKKAESESVACVFVDAGGSAPWGNRLAEDLTVNSIELDLLASDKTIKTYPQFMQSLMLSLNECFAERV